MGKLSREDAICLHRKMWNWIADENEKGNNVEKIDFLIEKGFFSNNNFPMLSHNCFCCEYAKWKLYENGGGFDSRCFYCPLEWGNTNKDLLFMCCDAEMENDDKGLYCLWNDEAISPIEKAKYARQIANLPERNEITDEIQV